MRVGNGVAALFALALVVVGTTAAIRQRPAADTSESNIDTENPADFLIGVWGAEKELFTRVEGPLRIRELEGELHASISGLTATATVEDGAVEFDFPRGQGSLRGSLVGGSQRIPGALGSGERGG